MTEVPAPYHTTGDPGDEQRSTRVFDLSAVRYPHAALSMRPTEAEMAAAIREYAESGDALERMQRLASRHIYTNWAMSDEEHTAALRYKAAREALHALAARLPQPGPFAAQERNGEVR